MLNLFFKDNCLSLIYSIDLISRFGATGLRVELVSAMSNMNNFQFSVLGSNPAESRGLSWKGHPFNFTPIPAIRRAPEPGQHCQCAIRGYQRLSEAFRGYQGTLGERARQPFLIQLKLHSDSTNCTSQEVGPENGEEGLNIYIDALNTRIHSLKV